MLTTALTFNNKRKGWQLAPGRSVVVYRDKGRFGHVTLRRNHNGKLTATKIFFDKSNICNNEELTFVRTHLMRPLDNLIHVLGVVPEGVGYEMEGCLGGNLRDFLQKVHCTGSYFPVNILAQIARGLEVMHVALNAAHRDIKPVNVVLGTLANGNMVAKIVDFGLVKMNVSKSAPDSRMPMSLLVVTLPYRAPELLFRLRLYNPFAIDVWSFGILCLDCLNEFLYMYKEGAPCLYSTLIEVAMKITGRLTPEDFPLLLQQASEGHCSLLDEDTSPRPLLKGQIVKEVRPFHEYIIRESSGVEHVYRTADEQSSDATTYGWYVGKTVEFRQQNITPNDIQQCLHNMPHFPRPTLSMKYARPKVRECLGLILRGMLEPDERKRWPISKIVQEFGKIVL